MTDLVIALLLLLGGRVTDQPDGRLAELETPLTYVTVWQSSIGERDDLLISVWLTP